MAATFGELPFGCRDCQLTPWTAGVLGTMKDVPRIRTVELNVTRDSTDLEGDDVKIATHTFGKGLEGSIEAGGVNAVALSVLEGGTVTAVTGPPKVTTYKVLGDQAEGYFKLESQMYADDGGDTHFIAWRVKASNGPNYSFAQGEFALTQCDLAGVYDETVSPTRLYWLVQNEVVTAIV